VVVAIVLSVLVKIISKYKVFTEKIKTHKINGILNFFAAILVAILIFCTFARATELKKWVFRNYRHYAT